MLSIKKPRDFIHVDEFWEADEFWSNYYIQNKVWVYVDEYRAELIGDEDYSRIIVHAGEDEGWLYSRRLSEKKLVHRILKAIKRPVSEEQLAKMGFTPWKTSYI